MFDHYPRSIKYFRITMSSSISTVNPAEMEKFSEMAADFWNPDGVYKPLHSMTSLRLDLLTSCLTRTGQLSSDNARPLAGLRVLDVGCGAGIFSEALARGGAEVTAIDPCPDNISAAREHAEAAGELEGLSYLSTTVEDHSQSLLDKYDAVVASEVIEHVDNQELFLEKCSEVLKPSGSLFLTTENRTFLSWLVMILGAEYVLGLLPRGTHQWDKFISPERISEVLGQAGCETRLVQGLRYNPLTNHWALTSLTQVNFALHAVKL